LTARPTAPLSDNHLQATKEPPTTMPFNIGPMELIVVLIIALVVLGPKKLPEVGKSLGRGMREFKESISGMADGDDERDEPKSKRISA
jgi:sec-independent protein translocase protein TatA